MADKDSLVDHQCQAYRQQLPLWRFLSDVYQGDSAWIDYRPDGSKKSTAKSRTYLPQEPGEDNKFYEARLCRSHFSDKFTQTIRDLVGVVFNNGLKLVDVPAQILNHWQAIDGKELPGSLFSAHLAVKAMALGHTFCLVDYAGYDPTVISLADLRSRNRRPFWRHFSPLQVINWGSTVIDSRQVLTYVVIRRELTLPQGRYGERQQVFYLELRPGRYDTWIIEEDRNRRKHQIHIPEMSGIMGRHIRGRLVAFDFIPLVCIYGGDLIGLFRSNPTLASLGKLNVHHYQVKSDHRSKQHYCCFPTPVRTGGDGSPLTLGPGRLVDVPIGGAFGWSEPNANSLAMSRVDVGDIERELDYLGMDYAIKPSDRQAAATTAVQAAKIESELYLFAQDLAKGLQTCLDHHAHWLGLDSGGIVQLQTKFFEQISNDPQLLLAYLRWYELEGISADELKEIARQKQFLPTPKDEVLSTYGSI
jgi:hypothetical protein